MIISRSHLVRCATRRRETHVLFAYYFHVVVGQPFQSIGERKLPNIVAQAALALMIKSECVEEPHSFLKMNVTRHA